MKSATDIFRHRLAMIFDFDGTLGPSTYEAVLARLGFDPDPFREEHEKPLVGNGWESPLAQAYTLELVSRGVIPRPDGSKEPVTKELLQSVGRELPLFPGVQEMFGRVRDAARKSDSELEVEFYLITAGFSEVAAATSIAQEFRRIYAGAYHYDERTGGIDAVKRILTHPEKPRYIRQICKGLELETANPLGAEQAVPRKNWRMPMDQVVYVGDGMSDIPAFEEVRKSGGVAIGVVERGSDDEWQAREQMHTDSVVENLAPSDYREGSELLQSLILGVQSIAARIALRRLSRGDDPEE